MAKPFLDLVNVIWIKGFFYKPFNFWTLNTNTYTWEAPVAYPETYNQGLMDIDDITPKKDLYNWNEQTLSWDLIS